MLALVEPYIGGFLADRPHLGCAMLIAACNATGIGVKLIPGQVQWLRYTCLQGQEELWHLLMELPVEDADRLYIKDIRENAKNQGEREFSKELAVSYSQLIEQKTPRAYLNIRSMDQFARLADAADKVFRHFLHERKATGLSIISNYLQAILDSNARYLCISLEMHMDAITRTLMEEAKRQTGCKIIIGGSVTPFLRDKEIEALLASVTDYLVIGMADEALPALIADIEENRNPCLRHGVLALRNDSVEGNLPVRVPSPNQLLLPDFSQFDLSRYFSPRVVLPFQTARGCSWRKCAFCTHSKIYLDQYQALDIEKAIQAIATLKEKYHCNHFVLHDEELPSSRALALSERILEKGISPIYIHCLARLSKGYDDLALLNLMYRAGFRAVSWGMESGAPKVLRQMHKGTNIKRISRILYKAYEQGISNCCFILFGFPGESLAEASETLSFLANHSRIIQQVMISSFTWAKGSPLDSKPGNWGVEFQDKEPGIWHVQRGMNRKELTRFINMLWAKINFGREVYCTVPCQPVYYNGNIIILFKSAATPVYVENIGSVPCQDSVGNLFPVSLGDWDLCKGSEQLVVLNLKKSLWLNRFHPKKIRLTHMEKTIHNMSDGRHTFRDLVKKLAVKENMQSGQAEKALLRFFKRMAQQNSMLLFQSKM